MEKEDEILDIPLKNDERDKKIEYLKSFNFDDFKIHNYFKRSNNIKHNVSLEEVKKIFYQFDKIVAVFKRPGNSGFKYSFIYKLKENESFYLCFLLDENPPIFFNAYPDYRKVNKSIRHKIQSWAVKENAKNKHS